MSDDAPEWQDEAQPGRAAEPRSPFPPAQAEPALTDIARLWPLRLGIGLAQGLLAFALFHTRASGLWPGADPYLFSALALAGLFVPLLLLEGAGTIAPKRLLPFAGIAAGLLALTGWYQHWRSFGAAAPGPAALLLCALALIIAQAALHGRERGHRWRMPYAELFVATWILGARLLIWGWTALLGFLVLQASGLAPERGDPFALLLLAVVSASGFQLSAALPRFTSTLADMLAALAGALLPLAAAAALLIASLALARGPAPLLPLFLVLGALLVAINASHRGGEDRKPWRDGAELFGSVLLLVLAGLALWSLAARIATHGWTAPRLIAVTGAALFAAYGAGYTGAALLFLRRGGALARIPRVNQVMAVMMVLACAALVSPLADPHRLAADAQAARLQDGRAQPDGFDFAHLENDGTRFGRAALAALSLSLYPDIARAAQAVHGPIVDPHAPHQIGPNIRIATPGARLPATLLTRDWSPVLGAPACLTRASESCEAHLLDLNQDGREEILLVTGDAARWWAAVLEADEAGRFALAGRLTSGCGVTRDALSAGRVASLATLPGWNTLSLAGSRPGVAGASCSD